MMEKAQALKEKNNLEIPKGKKPIPTFSGNDLDNIASKVGLHIVSQVEQGNSDTQQILDMVADRNQTFCETCKYDSCVFGHTQGELPPKCSKGVVSSPKVQCQSPCNLGVGRNKESIEIRVVAQNEMSDKESMGEDPATPRNSRSSTLDLVADLEEREWTKVANRKKNKKKSK